MVHRDPTLTCNDYGHAPDPAAFTPPWPASAGGASFTFRAGLGVGVAAEMPSARGKASRKKITAKVVRSLTREGPVAGTHATVTQVVDQFVTRSYRKRVELADGTVVTPVIGPLHDQSLHG